MATEVTLILPDDVYDRAARLARMTNRDVKRVLAEAIESALFPIGPSALNSAPIGELPDRELPASAELRMSETQGKRLDRLLDRQQSGELSEAERGELTALMQIYHETLVRKAQALSEAARRGWRESPAA